MSLGIIPVIDQAHLLCCSFYSYPPIHQDLNLPKYPLASPGASSPNKPAGSSPAAPTFPGYTYPAPPQYGYPAAAGGAAAAVPNAPPYTAAQQSSCKSIMFVCLSSFACLHLNSLSALYSFCVSLSIPTILWLVSSAWFGAEPGRIEPRQDWGGFQDRRRGRYTTRSTANPRRWL